MDYRFHPVIHQVEEILESRELDAIKDISVTIPLPNGLFKENDVRYDYTLGALMDLGCQCYFSKDDTKFTLKLGNDELHSISFFLDPGFSAFCST